MKKLILLLFLTGCATNKNVRNYQDNFYIGCMNAYYFSVDPPRKPSKEAHYWCVNQEEKVFNK